jgi:hypothetical protein
MSSSDSEQFELDARLRDPAILEEIELYSDLMILAAASTERLAADEIDRALRVRPDRAAG